MKNTNTILKAGLSATAILALTISWAYAMWNGQGQWNWGGNGLGKYATSEEKTKLQSLSWDERTEYMNELKSKYNVSGGHRNWQWKWNGQGQGQWGGNGQGQAKQSGHDQNPADMIKDIPMSDISDIEKELLINQYGEERMARDLYTYASEKYPNVNTFGNISKSEQKHMDTIKVLLDRYSVWAPSDYAKDNELYNTLKAKIDLSEKDAIEVGIMIEKVDIDNIVSDVKSTDNDDFKVIFSNIGWASYNHLRGFIKALNNAGYTTDIDYSNYLTDDEINTRWGWLKVKLAEKLEAEWVSLPEQASSKYIKEKCNNDDTHWNNGNKWNRNNFQSIDRTKVDAYKKVIEDKYSTKINAMSEEKLTALVEKIVPLIKTINASSKYSDSKKEQYTVLLTALKEVVQDKLSPELDMDSLIN